MIGTNDPTVASSVTLAQAPFQVDQHRDEYGRFILLFNLGPVAAPYTKAIAAIAAGHAVGSGHCRFSAVDTIEAIAAPAASAAHATIAGIAGSRGRPPSPAGAAIAAAYAGHG